MRLKHWGLVGVVLFVGLCLWFYGSYRAEPVVAAPVAIPLEQAATCRTFTSNDVPKAIPDDTETYTTSRLPIAMAGRITAVTVTLTISHTYPADLEANLCLPNNVKCNLFDGDLTSTEGVYTLSYSDSSVTALPTDPPYSGVYRANDTLAAAIGQRAAGFWRLLIRDEAGADVGDLTAWELELCTLPIVATHTPTPTSTITLTPSPTLTPTIVPLASCARKFWYYGQSESDAPITDGVIAEHTFHWDTYADYARGMFIWSNNDQTRNYWPYIIRNYVTNLEQYGSIDALYFTTFSAIGVPDESWKNIELCGRDMEGWHQWYDGTYYFPPEVNYYRPYNFGREFDAEIGPADDCPSSQIDVTVGIEILACGERAREYIATFTPTPTSTAGPSPTPTATRTPTPIPTIICPTAAPSFGWWFSW